MAAKTMPVPLARAHTPIEKGARVMERPNIVETYKIGGSTIQIADNYVRTDPDEIERILDEFHAAGWAIWNKLQEEADKNQTA